MAANLRLYFKLMGVQARMDILWFLRDTRICLIMIIGDAILAAASISGVMMMSQTFGGIGGMSPGQVLFMLGYAHLLHGVIGMFFNFNIAEISRTIGRGQFDHMLIQPVPIWMQLATQGFVPLSGLAKPIVGLVAMSAAISQLGTVISALWILRLALHLFVSVITVLSVVYLTSCAAFYAPVAAEEISTTVWDLFSTADVFPLGALPGPLRWALATVLPVGCAAWLPSAELFSVSALPAQGFIMLCVMFVFLTVAILIFRRGIAYYVKTGSRRYHGRGHRR